MKKEISLRLSIATVVSWLQPKKVILSILLILAVGSFLRIYGLGVESLWLDESISVDFSSGSVGSIVTETSSRNNPPLYWIMLHYWMNLFGTSEVAARSLSAIWGILAILVTYLVGRELFNSKIGLIASFLSAISYFHIYYAQEARTYALLLLLSLLSYLFFIKILKQNRNWYYLCYFLANFLLGYTHIYGLFIIASQIFYFCLLWNKYQLQRWRLTATLIATLVSLSPLIILLGPKAMHIAEHGIWIPEPSLLSIVGTFTMYAGYGIGRFILLLLFFLLALISLFFIERMEGKWIPGKPLDSLKSMSWRTRFKSIEELLLLIVWLWLPIVIPFIASHITAPFFWHKYTIGASPALYILVAKGINTLAMKKLLYPVLIVIIAFSGLGLHSYYVNDVKQQWREVAELVELNTQENDVLLFCVPGVQRPFDYYYQGKLEKFRIGRDVENAQKIADFVNGATSAKDRLWLIMGHGGQTAPIRSYLTDKYGSQIVLEQEFIGVHVLLIEIRQAK